MLKKGFALIICTIMLSGCLTPSQSTAGRRGIIHIPSDLTLKVNNKNVSIPLTDYYLIHHNGDGTISETINDTSKPSNFKTPRSSTYTKKSEVKIKPIKNNPKMEVIEVTNNNNNDEHKNIQLKNRSFRLPSKKGNYQYTVQVVWTNCRATYIFLVKIE